ncbi:MAG: helix-turn-helix domain-containing protein [Phaeodactylibacter sp.]|nr:helix-turn-helix domain-containing protein [Phaeodactylibacter sp.]MCB9304880.1 helix-turn-helix domain-containing protein [Lewinellaceae bacterium]
MSALSRELDRAKRQITKAVQSLEEIAAMLAESEGKPVGGDKPFLTEQDLAEAFGKHVATIQRWRKEGKLDPYHQQGRAFYWLREDFERLLEERKVFIKK